MKPYAEMSKEELTALRRELKAKYHEFQTRDLSWICPEESQALTSWIFPWV